MKNGNHTMRAACFVAPRRIRVEEVERPRPGPGEVRVRLEGCGVCASNLPSWEGRAWFKYPFSAGAPGHEGWGRIDAIGDGIEHLRPGERVAMLSYHAYAEFDVAKADALIRIPDGLEEQPFPGEPLGCAMNVFRRSEIQAGHTVAIIGIGFLGALLTRLAAHAGARVIAISRRPFALEMARRHGASETIPLGDHCEIVGRVKELTGQAGCERVIEAVGKQWPLDLAGELIAERGRLIVAGYHQDGLRQVNMRLWNWRGIDVINAHERDPRVYLQGMEAAAGAVASGTLDPVPLYTHRFGLHELPDALQNLEARPAEFLKALICYE